MNIGIVYVISALICMLQTSFILNRTITTKHKETIDVRFCQMLGVYILFFLVDAGWGICEMHLPFITREVFTFFGYAFHTVAAFSAFIWLRYMFYYVRTKGTELVLLKAVSMICLIMQFAIIFSNLFTGMCFYIDENCIYHMGPLRKVMYCFQISYYVITILYATYKLFMSKNDRKTYFKAMIFSTIPLGCAVLQYFIYNSATYSLGFMFSAFIIYSYTVTDQREQFMEEQYHSLDKKQSSIIEALAGDFLAIYYVDCLTGDFDKYVKSTDENELLHEQRSNENFFRAALKNITRTVVPEEQDKVIALLNRESLIQSLRKQNYLEIVVRKKIDEEIKYYKYRYVLIDFTGEEKIIVGVYDIDEFVRNEMKRQEEMRLARENETLLRNKATELTRDANTDELTGIPNRRAYENAMKTYQETNISDELVYISMDLNCLKTMNDSLGHDAGDELLKGAAFCMQKHFGKSGNVYRIGGDEFAALIICKPDDLPKLFKDFEEEVMNWAGAMVKELSISYGYVIKSEYPDLNVYEIAKLADKKMYQYKEKYYAARGIDRLGQQAAFDAVCRTYSKILKVNLSKDTYSIIQMQDINERNAQELNEHFSDIISSFVAAGNVHKDDVEHFLKQTDVQFLREYFKNDTTELCISYRKYVEGCYRKTVMQMIPAKAGNAEDMFVYLYVKNIDY